MPLIIVERTLDRPNSDEDLTAGGIRESSCRTIYSVKLRRTVLSADRVRMICEYESPDAGSVRRVLREAGNTFDRVWVGKVIG
jgi:Protein of unknown function (DUF4242)